MSALWISALVETAVRSTALLGIAALVTLVLRRRSAAIRHLVWGLALAGVLVLPLAGTVLPGMPVPVPQALADVLPASLVATADVAPTRESLALAPSATDPRVEMRSSAESGTATKAADAAPGRLTSAAESPAIGGSPPTAPAASSATAASAAIPWGPVLLTIWTIGATALAAWVLASVRNTRRLAADAAEVTSPEWLDLLRDVLAHLDIRRPVRLLQSERAVTPMTWGWRRPVVVIPAAASGWSRERRSVVLRHELAHIRRGDVVTQMLARSVCALYWFNPAVWFAAYRLRVERERACDDEVLRLGTRASDYANHLLDIARERHAPGLRAAAAVAMAQRSQLEGRMRAILDPRVRRNPKRSSTVIATVVLTGAALAASAVTPTAQSRGAAVPVAPGEQKPRTETDVVVAPHSAALPASKAQPRARDQGPVGAFSATTAARLGEEQSQVKAPTENVAQTNAGNGDGQDADATAAAVESQQRELEELYEEARRLHEEALRQAEQMRRQAERVLARDLERLRRHVEDTRALLERARTDDAGETSEVQQRSDLAPGAVESQSRTREELYEDLKQALPPAPPALPPAPPALPPAPPAPPGG